MIGESRKTKFILKCIGMESLEKIESWINNIKTEDFMMRLKMGLVPSYFNQCP